MCVYVRAYVSISTPNLLHTPSALPVSAYTILCYLLFCVVCVRRLAYRVHFSSVCLFWLCDSLSVCSSVAFMSVCYLGSCVFLALFLYKYKPTRLYL